MAEPTFQPSRIARAWREAEELFAFELDLEGTGLAEDHTVPGQYVQLRLPGHAPGFFAIASAPGAPRMQFLVKRGAPLADALAHLTAGATVEVSAPQGKGFPIAGQEGKNILLFAVGSGISAIRSLLLHVLDRRSEFGQVALFYGVRSPEHFAYQHEFEDWEARGLKFVRTISRPEGVDWVGHTGYVQEVLAREHVDVDRSVAFVCGLKGMVQGVTTELERRGLAAVHTNF